MKIVSFAKPLTVTTVLGDPTDPESKLFHMSCNPGERYLLNDDQSQHILNAKDNMLDTMSDFEPLYKDYVKRPLSFKGQRVLFYRCRGIGDQLVASALARYFTEKLKSTCFQLSDRGHEELWVGNPFIQGLPVRFPLGIDAVMPFNKKPFYNYAFFIESLAEWNTEPEQRNVYDTMFNMVGIDHSHVPPEYKRPVYGQSHQAAELFKKWKTEHNVPDKYIAFQLRATNAVRTPPAFVIDRLMSRLCDVGLPVICLDDHVLSEEHAEIAKKYPNARDLTKTTASIQLYGQVVTNAHLFVGPDSSGIHFAASSGTPAIGVWGPFSYESRARYYPHHYPLQSLLCPKGPCFNYLNALPVGKCPEGADQQHCMNFDGMTPELVDKVVSEVVINHKIAP
jgi:ADP-heptose:LPS heptosyltransferase